VNNNSLVKRWGRWCVLLAGALVSVAAGTATQGATESATYTYDDAGRLKQVTYDDGTGIKYTLDSAGNRTLVTVADTLAPSVPAGLSGNAISASRVDLTWTASTAAGIATLSGYKVYRGGSQIGTSPTATYSDTTVVGSTTYTYTVASYDTAGNTSAQSSPVNVATPDITKPSKPAGLQAAAASPTQINLTWQVSTDTGGSGLAGYKVYRFGAFLQNAPSNSYSDAGLTPDTSYTYAVSSIDGAGNESVLSDPVTFRTPVAPDTTPPTPPPSLSASAPTSNLVNLSWGNSTDTGGSGFAGYRIYRGGSFLTSTTGNSYADSTVVGTTPYTYIVESYDNADNRAQSSVSITTPDTIKPSIPSGLGATAAGPNQINLSWGASSDTGGSGLVGYRISRGTSLATVTPLTTTSGTSFSDTSVLDNTTYFYTIDAYDNAGNHSDPSAAASATTPILYIQITDDLGAVVPAAAALYAATVTCSPFVGCVFTLKQKYGSQQNVAGGLNGAVNIILPGYIHVGTAYRVDAQRSVFGN
jgi:YD repeat-containing protein